jgi:hypothetical protein
MHSQIVFSSTDRLHRIASRDFLCLRRGVDRVRSNGLNWHGIRLRLRALLSGLRSSGPHGCGASLAYLLRAIIRENRRA